MASAAQEYGRVLVIGNELLQLLQPPLTERALERVEQLVAERQALAESTAPLIRDGVSDPDTIGLLQQILIQQRALTEAMQRTLGSIQQSRADSQRTLSNMRDMQRILSGGPRSGHLNQRK